jgi:hypothetical protein
MKTTEIRSLIDPARNGDKDALLAAVELAERLLLEQELARAPAGIRTRALQALANYHKTSRHRAKRQKLAEERNTVRSETVRAPIRKALENIALHDKKMKDLVRVVISYLTLNRLACPCDETIEREIRNMRGYITNKYIPPVLVVPKSTL